MVARWLNPSSTKEEAHLLDLIILEQFVEGLQAARGVGLLPPAQKTGFCNDAGGGTLSVVAGGASGEATSGKLVDPSLRVRLRSASSLSSLCPAVAEQWLLFLNNPFFPVVSLQIPVAMDTARHPS